MPKTPGKIKKWLECDPLAIIRQLHADNCRLTDELYNAYNVQNEQLVRINQLEAERDALLKYLTESHFVPCDICKHDVNGSVMGCKRVREIKGPCFEWRGVQKEDSDAVSS